LYRWYNLHIYTTVSITCNNKRKSIKHDYFSSSTLSFTENQYGIKTGYIILNLNFRNNKQLADNKELQQQATDSKNQKIPNSKLSIKNKKNINIKKEKIFRIEISNMRKLNQNHNEP
jgi:hypothetical protein